MRFRGRVSTQMTIFILFFLHLSQLQPGSFSARVPRNSWVAATGSSILFPGTDKEFDGLHWEFSNPSRTLPILNCGKSYQEIYDQYKTRVELNKSNGSFLLKDLHKADSGEYKITVDLDPSRTRILTLTVLDPLSTPHISRNGSLESHTITLICEVQSGIANSVRWTRGGLALPDDERYWLSEGNSTLTISDAQESDSGYYTCTFSNLVSQSNNSYQLTIKGPEFRTHLGLILPFGLCVSMFLLVLYAGRLH
ncbi:hepatocyte cell adhesion molecule-like isoform X2 [Scyliorhinus canicula]|uniref:hepatocyte cell adhesion molecule-like isoform X2 n=1 Tax=Scyliorhinus canicula TaxID=7830 RepID=UPI0018F5F8B1|nr:hepatocyte cell adhesion molecule-like isoform X2 [Scyliorhinus canicula]